jgi:hypothetical protein
LNLIPIEFEYEDKKRMVSSGMLRRVELVRTDVSEEFSASIISSYKSHTANMPEDGILHSHRRENLKSYIALTGWTL